MNGRVSDLKDSNYLKKEDCPLSLTIDRVEQENVGMEGKPDMKYVMYFRENEKGLILNITNGEIMRENFGTEFFADWTGRHVDLYSDPNVMYAGKRVGGIRVKSNIDTKSADKADEDRQRAREFEAAKQVSRQEQANVELQAASSKRGHPDFPNIPDQEAYWTRKEKEEQSDVPF